LNQNRNNNRRRGRGNNRGQGGGGGNQGNRIDNRARGNAPQLLEKYRKMAHDASLNGDRVQTEYYLQFADHYFRVIADNRVQKDDGRPVRQGGEREGQGQSQDFEDDFEDEFGDAGRQRPYQTRRERDEEEERQQQLQQQHEGEAGIEGEPAEEEAADENPFVRDQDRTRRGRGRGRAPAAGNGAEPRNEVAETAREGGFDPGLLPPSIPRDSRDEEEAPRPRRTRRPRATERPADEGDSEPLEAVG